MLVRDLFVGAEVTHTDVVGFQVVVYQTEAMKPLQQRSQLNTNLHNRLERKEAASAVHDVLEGSPESVDDQEGRELFLAATLEDSESFDTPLFERLNDGDLQIEHGLVI